ncbi:MAG: hypothetical protein J7647_00840 [Cyanobacteria bacterium SBLK]|nr:hypothetical protein [Cyanobacteria bacterium SBLK]
MQWLESWGILLAPEERKPERVCDRLLDYLASHDVLLLLDSLETLLVPGEDAGGTFADEMWAAFLNGFLATETMRGRIILTSQELPVEIAGERYRQLWHRCVLTGLREPETRTSCPVRENGVGCLGGVGGARGAVALGGGISRSSSGFAGHLITGRWGSILWFAVRRWRIFGGLLREEGSREWGIGLMANQLVLCCKPKPGQTSLTGMVETENDILLRNICSQ